MQNKSKKPAKSKNRGGRPSKKSLGQEKQSCDVVVTFTPTELVSVNAAAQADGLPRATWMRAAVLRAASSAN